MNKPAELPADEADRLAALRELLILDSPREALFDRIVELASDLCGTPVALLSLVDEERQWFKAQVGLPGVRQTPRDEAFCAHAILGDEAFVVPDASADPRFTGNPLVTAEPAIRFYAGAPLKMPDGARIGTLCVIDHEMRNLDADRLRRLQSLADIASEALQLRRETLTRAIDATTQQQQALIGREAQYRAIVESQSELVSLADVDGTLVYVNPAYAAFFASTPQALVGSSLFDAVEPADRNAVRQQIQRVIDGGRTESGNNRSLRPDGSDCWVAWTNGLQHDLDGRPLLHSVGRDISGEVQARRELQRQTATLRSITEAIPALVTAVGADRRYRFVNRSFERWVGASRDGILGCTMREVLGEHDYNRSLPRIERALAGDEVTFQKDYPDRRDWRHLSLHYIPLRIDEETLDGFVVVAQDITQHKREEERLLQLSQRDVLTDLLNRAGFHDHLNSVIQTDGGATLALLFIDLDHFKEVNDKHGHPVGDQLLQALAKRLQNLVRPTDAVARLGGDEFAIALSGVRERSAARAVAAKVLAVAAAPFEFGSLSLRVGASVGIAFGVDPIQGAQDLLKRADARLYEAKEAGRGRQCGAED